DISGPWNVIGGVEEVATFVQTGNDLSVDLFDMVWTGTVDPVTRSFSLATVPGPTCGFVIGATVDATGSSFSGSITTPCPSRPFPIRGHRCGNGVGERGEQCDDGSRFGVDCCSFTCTYQPVFTGCDGPPGSDQCIFFGCDGAGTCVNSGNTIDGMVCNDGVFCNGDD